MGKTKRTIPTIYPVRISTYAINNIEEITDYIAFSMHELQNAVAVGDSIFKTIDKIGLNPFAYKEYDELPTKSKMYRRALCLSWNIIYKITANEIVILAIIHTSRKPSTIKSLRVIR